MSSETNMNRCDLNETRVNTNDEYSIRMMQPQGIQQSIGEIASHHYIDIEKKLGNDMKCLMTIGLRSDQKRTGNNGIISYLGTEFLSPDFTDSKCTGLMDKCKEKCGNDECRGNCANEKGRCLGANIYMLSSGHKILRGSIKSEYSDHKNYHNLNSFQVNIINWFLDNSTMVNDNRQTKSYYATLPFTFSFTPNFCSIKDWGPGEYYNCQKFVSVFHKSAKLIWNVLKEYHPDQTKQKENKEDTLGTTWGDEHTVGQYKEDGHIYTSLGYGGSRKKRRGKKTKKRKKTKKSKRRRTRTRRRTKRKTRIR